MRLEETGRKLHKFTRQQRLCLVDYQIEKDGGVCLLAFGSHENFCRDLQKHLKVR